MKLPTPEEYEEWKKSKCYQYSGDEVFQWIAEFVKPKESQNPDVMNYSSKGEGYERINHWITAPKEDK